MQIKYAEFILINFQQIVFCCYNDRKLIVTLKK